MEELPPELAALSQAAGEVEKRRALDAAIAFVAAVDGARRDVAVGLVAAAVVAGMVELAAAVALWRVPDRHWGAAIAFCVAFPVAARLSRRARFARLRRLDADGVQRRALAAWQHASPGQRAALQVIVKKSP